MNILHSLWTEICLREPPFTVTGGGSEILNSSLRFGDTTSIYHLKRISLHIDIVDPHKYIKK